MQMFVAVSRGREWVSLVDSGRQARTGKYYDCLPGEEFLERENPAQALKSGKSPAKPAQPAVSKPSEKTDGTGSASRATSDWEPELMKLAVDGIFSLIDNRPKGGAIWVKGGNELARLVEPLGFVYCAKRGGWWRK